MESQDGGVLLLLLGSVQSTTGDGKKDPGWRDLALVLREVRKGEWERVGRVVFWDYRWHFKKFGG